MVRTEELVALFVDIRHCWPTVADVAEMMQRIAVALHNAPGPEEDK